MRPLLSVAAGPSVASAAMVTALVLVTLVAAGSDLTTVGASAAATWLAAHQVPMTIAGSPLSVLPLLPTGLLIWATARSTATAAAAGADPRWVLAAATAGPLGVVTLALTLTHNVAGQLPLAGPPVALTVLVVLAVHLLGGLLGLAQQPVLCAHVRQRLPTWVRDGAALARRALRNVLIGAAVVTAFRLVWSLPTAVNLVEGGGGVTGGLGLLALSVAYLPNVVLGVLSVAVGPGAIIGQTTITAFGAVHAPLPPLPVLAVIPDGDGSWWWPVVLLVPALAAVHLGRSAADRCTTRAEALRTVTAAAVLAGVVLAVGGELAGGTLGSGALTPVAAPSVALGSVSAAWLAIVGFAAVLLRHWRADSAAAGDGDVAGLAPAEKTRPTLIDPPSAQSAWPRAGAPCTERRRDSPR